MLTDQDHIEDISYLSKLPAYGGNKVFSKLTPSPKASDHLKKRMAKKEEEEKVPVSLGSDSSYRGGRQVKPKK